MGWGARLKTRWRVLVGAWTLVALACGVAGPLAASEPGEGDDQEYLLKAAWIYKIANFVTWPEEVFPDKKAPIVIGVLGKDPFGKALEQTLRSRKVDGRGFEVKRFASVKELEACHILFTPASQRRNVKAVREFCQPRHVLWFSEDPSFLGHGAVVDFYIHKKKIAFAVQVDEAKRNGLKVDSKLLQLAKVVRDKDLR